MSIARMETKFRILKNLELFAKLLKSFPESKKQIKYTRKMLCTYSREASEKHCLLSENEKEDIDYFITEFQKIAFRLQKAKKPDDFKRLSQALEICQAELTRAIGKTELQLAEIKGKAVFGNLFEKAKSLGGSLAHGIENIKSSINNSMEESNTP